MKHDEFVGHVQNRARLASRGEALRAVRATLETLGERLAGGEADDLAAQLPPEIGDYLREAESDGSFSLDTFLDRVAEREGTDLPVAVHHARAVVAVLDEAVSAGEMDDVHAQLPEEYNPLFESGSEGSLT
jgi:uncharacterized protein (DUF2267 family)